MLEVDRRKSPDQNIEYEDDFTDAEISSVTTEGDLKKVCLFVAKCALLLEIAYLFLCLLSKFFNITHCCFVSSPEYRMNI